MPHQLVWQVAPDDLRFIDSLRHLNGLLLIAAATWVVVRAVNGFAEGVIAQHPLDVADNLQARRVLTQTRVLARTANSMLLLVGGALMLMTFPGARQIGASLLASAGLIGIVAGLAAKPVFSNLIEKPFQNWTRSASQLTGSVFIYADYRLPLAPVRQEVERLVNAAPEWDGRFFNLQVTDATERTMQLRELCTAASSSLAFDLRCKVREGIIDFMQREHPQSLTRLRIRNESAPSSADNQSRAD